MKKLTQIGTSLLAISVFAILMAFNVSTGTISAKGEMVKTKKASQDITIYCAVNPSDICASVDGIYFTGDFLGAVIKPTLEKK